jgi:hypothetical protein
VVTEDPETQELEMNILESILLKEQTHKQWNKHALCAVVLIS